MADKSSLSRTLARIYFLGWVALIPLVILSGLIVYMSYHREFEYFLEGLWLGILNLGILWTGVFVLICVVKFIAAGLKDRSSAIGGYGEFFPERISEHLPLGLDGTGRIGIPIRISRPHVHNTWKLIGDCRLGLYPNDTRNCFGRICQKPRSTRQRGTSVRSLFDRLRITPHTDCVRYWP